MNEWEGILAASLKRRWKNYQRALKDCQRKFSEKAVHNSRIQTRRLLSLIELLAVFLAETHFKRARRALKQHLDVFDSLRDTHVQLLLLEQHRRQFPETRSFHDFLARREKRCLKKASRGVRRVKVQRAQKVVHSLTGQLKKLAEDPVDCTRHRHVVLHTVQSAFTRAVELQRKMDPGLAETIHRTRIAFKRFRYMIEALKPIFADVTPERLAEMQDLQSMMGEVQDTEMFLVQLDKFTRGKESRAQSLASFRHWLLRRQTSQIVYCLKHADRLHRFWPLEHGPRREAPEGERKERQLTTR